MKELKEYYEKRKKTCFKWSILCWALLTLIFNFIKEFGSTLIKNWAVNPGVMWITLTNEKYFQDALTLIFVCVSPTAIVIFSYFTTINHINKKGWKKKFPQYDVSGQWIDTTTYTKSIDGQKKGWINPGLENVQSPVHIEQTCHTISVKPSICNGFEWHSVLADWDHHDNLNILYTVEYYEDLQKQGYPERRRGYEKMHIDRTGLSKKQKPCKMVGKFWHCISYDGKPMYMGDVTYERKLSK